MNFCQVWISFFCNYFDKWFPSFSAYSTIWKDKWNYEIMKYKPLIRNFLICVLYCNASERTKAPSSPIVFQSDNKFQEKSWKNNQKNKKRKKRKPRRISSKIFLLNKTSDKAVAPTSVISQPFTEKNEWKERKNCLNKHQYTSNMQRFQCWIHKQSNCQQFYSFIFDWIWAEINFFNFRNFILKNHRKMFNTNRADPSTWNKKRTIFHIFMFLMR